MSAALSRGCATDPAFPSGRRFTVVREHGAHQQLLDGAGWKHHIKVARVFLTHSSAAKWHRRAGHLCERNEGKRQKE